MRIIELTLGPLYIGDKGLTAIVVIVLLRGVDGWDINCLCRSCPGVAV